MPRRRHDTSSDDSDSSGSDSSDAGSRRQSRQQKNRSDRQSSSVSPEEKKKIVLKQKKPKSDSDSSPERSRSRKRTKPKQRHDSSSDSDQRSPVKKSVVSKVEKAKDKSGKSKKDKNKTDKTDKRQLSEPEISPDKKRARGRDSSLPKSGKGGKTSSNANRSLQSSQSPERRQRSDERIPRRDFKQNRSLSRNRNDSREPLRGQQSWSSDQNVGRYQGRDDRDWNIGRRSPDRRFPNDQRFPDRRFPERMSPDRRFPDRMSPDRQYNDRRSPDRRFSDRRFPDRRSPDRKIPDIISPGRRFPDRRSPNRRFPDQLSPDRGGHGWNNRAARDRYDNGPRAMDNRQEARSRSFERHPDQRARSFEGGNISGDRTKDQSGSPQKGRQRNDSYRSEDREIENSRRRGDFSDIQKDKRGKKNRSVSVERKRNNKSKSPDSVKKAVKVQAPSASVEKEKLKKDKNEDKNDRKKDKKKANTDSDVEKLVSKKKDKIKNTKEKSSKKTKDNSSEKNGKKSRDDSLERSFERSKNSISFEEFERSHSRSMEVSDESQKKTKKTGSKRQRSASISESESPRQGKKQKDKSTGKRAKKIKDKDVRSRSKSVEKLFKKKGKKVPKSNIEKRPQSVTSERSNSSSPQKYSGNKKQKMSKRKSRSRSLSPLHRSNELERSTSSDVSVGKNHDLTRFESDPESGEITDSDEDAENKQQTVKSFINKPADEEIQSADDEKYWNDKRKGAKHVEEEPNKRKDVLPHKEKDHIQQKDKERGSKRKAAETKDPEPVAVPEEPVAEPAPKKPRVPDGGVAALTGRTGGAYIPPARLRAMQANITDKSSVEYQRISWEALKKSINGLVNKVNVSNIEFIVREVFQENIVRGRGLMARSIIQAQAASPTFTHVYAALVAVVNTKFPQNGELVLRRLITQFRRGYKRNDKSQCISSTRFVAHLVNQQVAHEILSLEILTLLLEKPTDDSVEVAIGFLKEVGQKLTEVSPRGINAIFERLRTILHEGQIDTRVQYMVEVMFAVRKDNFKDFQSVLDDLDLVEEEDQFTHLLTLEDAGSPEDILNVFKADPDFQENEEKYKILKKEILDEGSEDEDGSGSGDSGSDDDSDDEEDKEAEEAKQQLIIDQTETNMVALRRTIYLTIQSSLDFEECAHKLMKMELKPGQEVELCNMIQDCCAQMRTYEKFFGLLAGRFCMIDKKYVQPFQVMFGEQYNTIHRLETNKLRNIAKFFAHLLHTDSISWAVLECIKLNEDDTTSASRIFIKILFQELSEYLGLPKLNDRLKDVTLQEYFTGLLPRDNPRDTRFAINFFTTIGLGGLTDDLRDHLKNVSKKLMQQKKVEQQTKDSSDEDDDDDDSDSSSSDESSDDSDSESSNSDSSDSSDDGSKKKKKKGHEKRTEREMEKRKNIKGKKTVEKEKTKDKKGRKDKDQTNGANSKLDRKKDKKEEKKKEKERWKEEQAQKEREENFKRLSKLANYGDVPVEFASNKNDAGTKSSGKTDKGSRKTKSNKNKQARDADSGNVERKRSRNDSDRDGYSSRDGNVFSRDRDQFDARSNLDRSYDSSFDSRDERNDGRRGKKGREFVEVERDDRPIRIERNFERLDIYEDKFAKERERNLDFIRGREEYEDYYRGRGDLIRGGFVDPRDPRDGFRGPARGRGNMDDARFEGMYRERDLDRGFDEGRRRGGRMRSEERAPAGRDERRRRR